MKTISNREEANTYYKKINSGVDDFAKNTNARPSEIHNYLKKNGKVFLKRLEVDDVVGIENVLNDVLLHRKHMEDDKIITFESFSKLNENIFDVGVSTLEHEKVLADLFGTSLGHIESVDSSLHFYRINDFGKEIFSIVFSSEEINKIKNNLSEKVQSDLISKIVVINQLDGISVDPLKFWLSDFVDNIKLSEVVNSKISSDFVLNFILDSFNKDLSNPLDGNKFTNFKEYSNFVVWYT